MAKIGKDSHFNRRRTRLIRNSQSGSFYAHKRKGVNCMDSSRNDIEDYNEAEEDFKCLKLALDAFCVKGNTSHWG